MQNLTPGDVLVNRIKLEVTVIAVHGDKVWTTYSDCEEAFNEIDTIENLIAQGYTKKPTPWTPKEGENYWYITGQGRESWCSWNNDTDDLARLAFRNVFPDQATALEHKKKILAI